MTRLLQWAGKKVRWQAVALPGAVYLVVLLAGIGLSEWVRGVELGALAAIGLAAVAVCWWMITQRGHRWWYWLVITAGGVFAAVFFLQDVQVVLLGWVGKLLTLIPQMVSQRSFESLSQLDPASIEVAVLFQVLKENLSSWWSDLLAGSAAFNLQATLLVWNYAVWLLAAWLCWAVHRNWSPYISIIPVILGMSVIAAYTKKNSWILGVLMVASFGLVVFIQHYFRESQWDQREISYSVEIRIDIFILTLLISAVLVLLTLTIPSFSVRKIVDSVRELISPEEQLEIAPGIGLFEPASSGTTAGDSPKGEMPVEKLIGALPDPQESIIMQIVPDENYRIDAEGAPYWRSHSLEIYTGSGWLAGETTVQLTQPEVHLRAPSADSRTYEFSITFTAQAENWLYYPGKLISVNQPVDVFFRLPDSGDEQPDLYAAMIDQQHYRVEVEWTQYSIQELQTASSSYPEWIETRYLQLPDALPRRVRLLAEQITRDAEGPFQRAAAIERYLRHFPYSLQVPAPPAGQDVVDYFLFDLQQGYCDYFSSAMVVLARVVGLPARMVVGYAPGEYDRLSRVFLVRAAEAHTWVEVFFPELGWVEFEPTPNRDLIARGNISIDDLPVEDEFSLPTSAALTWQQYKIWINLVLLTAFAAAAVWFAVDTGKLMRNTPRNTAVILYSRLYTSAARMKFPVKHSATPFELADQIIESLSRLWKNSRAGRSAAQSASIWLSDLIYFCVLSIYGAELEEKPSSAALVRTWWKLQPFLVISMIRTKLHNLLD